MRALLTLLMLLGAGALSLVWGPAPARACSYSPSLYLAQPGDGATDVPTNVVPWFVGTPLDHPVIFTLRDASGADVPVEVVHTRGYRFTEYFEVIPTAALAPRTSYTLSAEIESITGSGGYMSAFTTGDGPLEGTPPALGPLDMQLADNSAAFSSCEDNVFACIATPPDAMVRATITTASEVEAELIGGASFARRDSPVASPFCVEVRARNLAGALGPVSRVCSDDARVYEIQTTHPVTCEGGRVVTDDGYADEIGMPVATGGGCSATPGRSKPTWLSLLVLPALWLVARPRSRRQRAVSPRVAGPKSSR